ncbi:hypothetical protein [Kribbella sp. NPDC051770]|uniref:hypothetical protein n=1 Tax=Kribbella sp. NPDC051770 TaxID=3155413 RepID=UPI003444CC56
MADDSPELLGYLTRLQRLTAHIDPTADSPQATAIRQAGASLDALPTIDAVVMTDWVKDQPRDVYTLGLAVGLSQEKLKNLLKAEFGTASWAKAATDDAEALVAWLDSEFGLLDALAAQRNRTYAFGDILAARGTSRQTASSAGVAGRLIEDAIEAIVKDLGLPYEMRGRFVGRNGDTGPADLAIPSMASALIAVACKGFDSTGSKLTAAVSEVTEMANVRFAHQYILAVVDGIGWLSRMGDFRRMYALAETRRIDGLYALADLDRFRVDLETAARRHGLLS